MIGPNGPLIAPLPYRPAPLSRSLALGDSAPVSQSTAVIRLTW